MARTNYEKYRKYLDFIDEYSGTGNAATKSKFDANANIENKNVATLSTEMHKGTEIGVNRLRMLDILTEMFGADFANEYIDDLDSHINYRHDETHPLFPYCVSVTLYPFICKGLKSIGGPSSAPKHLNSFVGNFVNLVFAISAQFAGAVATPEFLAYLDYFIRLEYGDDYYTKTDIIVDNVSRRPKTLGKLITDAFEQVCHSLNEPAAARNYQSVFWNIAYFDKPYFDALFEDFVFPDGTEMQWESVSWLQKYFMTWFNKERTRTYLTFPVETVNLVYHPETKEFYDEDWASFACEMWSKGHSFFCYTSDTVDSLSSCCRLKNGITENTFSYTLGAGGIATGSKAVITMNINRIVQDAVRNGENWSDAIRRQTRKNHKYLIGFNELLKREFEAKMLPIYSAGYISLDKQYLTIGINGLVEAAEFLGLEISPNQEYYDFCKSILEPIMDENRKARTSELMFNTEYVPGENLGIKNSRWDKKQGYFSPRDCYNSYFFRPDDTSLSIIDKMEMHGENILKYLDGGSACHINLQEHLTAEQYRKLLNVAAQLGCSYFTYNVPNTICESCGHISKHYEQKCPKCGSDKIDWITRIIGYAKPISKYSEPRQVEAMARYYHGQSNV